ncbi:unnamed protein product, partial [Rhizoctonia solani]
MSFALSSVPVDRLLAWSLGNGGKGYARIKFPFDLGWYNEQPSTRFLSFQHRKEPNGFRHEFIVLKMKDGSICRVERTGDPHARTHALTFQGSVAYDMIQSFRPHELAKACLDTSNIVAEVHLPGELDLKDVLNICRAIQEAGRTRNYTLQTFNCYFFSLALQCCITRLVARWEEHPDFDRNWKSYTEDLNSSLLGIDPTTHSLFRTCSALHAHSGLRSTKQFSMDIQHHFRVAVSNLTWEDITNGVCWYYELGSRLDHIMKEELLLAWWKAARLFMASDHSEEEGPNPTTNFSPNDDLDSLVHKCLNTLWAISKLASANEMPSFTGDRHTSQRLRSNMNSNSNNYQHTRSRGQVMGEQPSRTNQMECRGTELEEVKALTIAQWLTILWLHAKHIVSQFFGLFITLSVALVWVPASSQRIYIDTELTRIMSDLDTGFGHLDMTKMRQLAERLEKLYMLCDTNKRIALWKVLPWAQVTSVIEKPLSLTITPLPALEKESVLVAEFQERHILQRIELQAELVERVWLGSAVKVSAEIKQRLSLVWETFRNDPLDTVEILLTIEEVLSHLYEWGCKNVTTELDESRISKDPVARGGGGDVYLGELYNGARVALKCARLAIGNNDRSKLKKTAHELYVWSKCKHPNVLELIGVTHHRDQVAMVSPWMDNGDLRAFLRLYPNVDRHDLCVQIADGVAYLHAEKIVHGDIKGANVLISQDGEAKITDFGTSALKEYTLEFATTRSRPGLSIRWAAPEVLDE